MDRCFLWHFRECVWSNIGPKKPAKRLSLPVMPDEWTERLRCSICRKTGTAILCQEEDTEIPSVLSVPCGFKVVSDRYGPNFFCQACDAPLLP